MCGIAGILDLRGVEAPDPMVLQRMADALVHRGPDDDGFLVAPGVGFAHRRLSIVGLSDGRQPIFNEDRTVAVVFNGELFDYVERRAELEARGHRFATRSDTEVLVHSWEEYGDAMIERLRGQFAFALYDSRAKRVVLARDRLGIVPVFWSRTGDRLHFGSEIKAILASGEVSARPDRRGIDHIFTFFSMATHRTAFDNISAVRPGTFLDVRFQPGGAATIDERRYWDLDFPDRGQETDGPDAKIIEGFRERFFRAVEIRLRADVPVVGYLSGGVDSTTVMATAAKIRGASLPAFTIKIPTKKLDETDRALMAAR
ncbi:MAG: asparagine synthase (glutamine-hydrolyzing), partial [Planctomycetia bacterium]